MKDGNFVNCVKFWVDYVENGKTLVQIFFEFFERFLMNLRKQEANKLKVYVIYKVYKVIKLVFNVLYVKTK